MHTEQISKTIGFQHVCRCRFSKGTSPSQDRAHGRLGEADATRLDSVPADNVEKGALGLARFGLAKHIEDVVGPDRLPVPAADIHAHEDVALLDGRLRGGATRQDRLDVEPAAELGGDRRDVLGRDRLSLEPQELPDDVSVSGSGGVATPAVPRGRRAAGWSPCRRGGSSRSPDGPGGHPASPARGPCALAMASSPTRTSSSPGLKPAASAGLPGWTSETTTPRSARGALFDGNQTMPGRRHPPRAHQLGRDIA